MYTGVTKLLNELTGMALPKYLDSEQKTFSQFTEKLPCNFFALDSDLRNPIKATFLGVSLNGATPKTPQNDHF